MLLHCSAEGGSPTGETSRPRVDRALWLIVLLALVLRLPGVTRPLLGNFATKSAVYAMIARNLVEGRASILHPTLDVLRGGERSYHLTELPVSAYLTGGLWKVFGGPLDVWGRATSIGWSLVAVACFYFLLRDWHGEAIAWAGAAALALSPVAIIYGQSFQLEASVLALTALTVWAADRWLTRNRLRWLVAALLSAMGLLLTKVFMAYLIVPLVYLAWRRRGAAAFRSPIAWVAVVVAALPAALWYGYVYLGIAGGFGGNADRVYFSVRQSAGDHAFPHPLLGSVDFYKHLIDDLAGVALTPVGFTLAVLALCGGVPRRYVVWLVGAGLLVLLLPRKFYEMNYYWTATLLPLCGLAGIGCARALERIDSRRRGLILLGGAWLLFSLRLSVTPAFSTPAEDGSVLAAGQAVERVSRPEERVITLHGSSLDLLYYCNRPGWVFPITDNEAPAKRLESYRRQGARYFVVAGLAQLDRVAGLRSATDRLAIAEEGKDYVVYRLAPRAF